MKTMRPNPEFKEKGLIPVTPLGSVDKRSSLKEDGPFEEKEHSKAPLVLIAEDDEISQILMRESMEQGGFRVEVVEDGEEAVSAFKRLHPDVVLLDLMMPKVDGITVCAAIRDLPGGETVPVLIVTVLDDMETILNAFEAGATDFMNKPVNWMILQQRVCNMLDANRDFNELVQTKNRLVEAQRIARLGNWEWIVEGDRLIWSEETYRIFGIQRENFDGILESLYDRIHHEDRGIFKRSIEATLQEGKPLSIDHRIVLPGGSERFVHQQAEAISDVNGKGTRITGTIQDISERKRAERHTL